MTVREFDEDRRRALEILNVTRETLARLDLYADLLVKWQRAINLVSPSTIPVLWSRHFADSAQIIDLAPTELGWADLGSGAGFPGLVIAIMAMEREAHTEVHLIESDQRKAGFLREAARQTGAPAIVHAARAETAVSGLVGRVGAVTARALAPLPALLQLAEPLLTTGATGFFPKGQALESELEQASKMFEFEAEAVQSQTDKVGRIAVIRGLRRRIAPPSSRGNS